MHKQLLKRSLTAQQHPLICTGPGSEKQPGKAAAQERPHLPVNLCIIFRLKIIDPIGKELNMVSLGFAVL